MKTILFFWSLFFLFMSTTTISQQYNKLLIENAQWKVIQDNDATPWPDAMVGWLLRGDTIINEQQYKILFRRVFEEPYSEVIVVQLIYGFLREDTVSRIVYALESEPLGCDTIDEEYVLFDFSYEIGDTSKLCLQTADIADCILLDTSYTYVFGAYRILFQFCGASCEFIEGIGHQQGLLENPTINLSGGTSTYLFDYCVGTDEECNVFYVNLEENAQPTNYKIYPNPCKGSFHLENNSEIIDASAITINDLYGRKVSYSVRGINDHTVQIHLFSPGIYVLHSGQPEKFSSFLKIMNIY